MPYSPLNDLPADIRERAARVKLALFDVDGVLTDGRLSYTDDGREIKTFHVHDGLGLKRLMEDHKIHALLVVDGDERVVGALNIHDLLRARVV